MKMKFLFLMLVLNLSVCIQTMATEIKSLRPLYKLEITTDGKTYSGQIVLNSKADTFDLYSNDGKLILARLKAFNGYISKKTSCAPMYISPMTARGYDNRCIRHSSFEIAPGMLTKMARHLVPKEHSVVKDLIDRCEYEDSCEYKDSLVELFAHEFDTSESGLEEKYGRYSKIRIESDREKTQYKIFHPDNSGQYSDSDQERFIHFTFTFLKNL